ncbi:MFS transporter [Pseudomonadota bacterium]
MIISLVERLLNISAREVPRTAYAWIIRLLFKIGFIVGWTAIVAMFVTRFSITSLPFLFLIQALFSVVGMLLFSYFVNVIPVKKLILANIFIVAVCLLIAALVRSSDLAFFALIIPVSGLFIPQIYIFMSYYIEEFFSPLEGERVFSVIESAETIGGIIGGFLLANAGFLMGVHKLLFFWIFLLFLCAAFILVFEPEVPEFFKKVKAQKKEENPHHRLSINGLVKSYKEIKSIPYLQAILVFMLIQWIIAHFLEYQYTMVVEGSLEHSSSAAENEAHLAGGLGSLVMLFHGSALMIQLFMASRIVRKIGTFGGFLLHALVTFFSAISLLLGFNYLTAILAKNNFEVSGVVQKNAYETSYYAFGFGTSLSIREFFEGLIMPVGTIIGTLSIIIIQKVFDKGLVLPVFELCIIFLVAMMVYFSFHLQAKYTNLAKSNLYQNEDIRCKYNAIEILSQRGHREGAQILTDALDQEEHDEIKIKLVEGLSRNGYKPEIYKLLKMYDERNIPLRRAILNTISKILRKIKSDHEFYEEMSKQLKSIYAVTYDNSLKALIIKCLARVRHKEIMPMLNDANAIVRAYSIASLWFKKPYRKEMESLLSVMLSSGRREQLLAVCEVAHEIRCPEVNKRLIPLLKLNDGEIRTMSALALFKVGYYRTAEYLADLLLKQNKVILSKALEQMGDLDKSSKRYLNKILIRRLMIRQKKPIFGGLGVWHYTDLETDFLDRLKSIFTCLENMDEVQVIDYVLEARRYATPISLYVNKLKFNNI